MAKMLPSGNMFKMLLPASQFLAFDSWRFFFFLLFIFSVGLSDHFQNYVSGDFVIYHITGLVGFYFFVVVNSDVSWRSELAD